MKIELLKNKKISCAFCKGSGIQSPIGLLKNKCAVCGGSGMHNFDRGISCVYCGGGGRSILNHSLPCITCKGIGVIQAVNPLNMCGGCSGKGVKPGIYLACTKCKGKGVDEEKSNNKAKIA